MNKKIIIANWKMDSSFDEAQSWIENLNKKVQQGSNNFPEIVLCPPSVMIDYIDGLLIEHEFEEIEKIRGDIEQVSEEDLEKLITQLRIIKLGGQDCSSQDSGAFTGDISARMLKDCGAWYVIVGHSERRRRYAETNQSVSKKIGAAIKQCLVPIICIGESEAQRQNYNYQDFIIDQLEHSLPKGIEIKNLIVAYEPVWAIGSGKIPTIEQIEEIAALIKRELFKNKNISDFKIVYGGSVNQNNSRELLSIKNIDGLLVGGASLNPEEFFNILNNIPNQLHIN